MKTILSIFILALVLSSCKKEKSNESVFDVGVDITVKSKDGKDLLNPSTQNAYLAQNIKIFYLINGVKEEVFYENYDHPRNFMIYEKDGVYRMGLTLNYSSTEAYPITYVQWSENNTDTLKTEIFRESGIESCKDIWLNNNLVWKNEDYEKGERKIEIIK